MKRNPIEVVISVGAAIVLLLLAFALFTLESDYGQSFEVGDQACRGDFKGTVMGVSPGSDTRYKFYTITGNLLYLRESQLSICEELV